MDKKWPSKFSVDMEAGTLLVEQNGTPVELDIGSPDAFSVLSAAMLRTGWDNKYVYSFSWMGRPVIQLPDDMIRIQELIYEIKPDVIIETGVAHGGGLIYYASILNAMGKGRVIGVDIEIRPHNRTAIEAHEMFEHITLIEGNSVADEIVQQVADLVKPNETVLVFLDSNHTKAHVLAELEAYAKFVSPGSYILAMDGIMQHLPGAPRAQADWDYDNPVQAAKEFVANNDTFIIDEPTFPFNEGTITKRELTYWPTAYIKRIG